jgi:RNA polymerase sigma-70 factor (ECF subfamily)
MEGRHSAEPDPTVVRMVVAGSHAALAELYDRHAAAVFGASFRLLGQRPEAEEVVQETFLALWNRAEQFDPALGSLRTWLLTIARNRAIDRLRAAGRKPAIVSFGVLDEDAARRDTGRRDAVDGRDLPAEDEASDPERQAELSALRVTVHGALEGLPRREREALILAYFQGLTQQEIAVRLEWPLGTVKTRTRRALRHLRVALGSLVDPTIGAAPGPQIANLSASHPGDPDGSR